jgi:hypothetical protein
MEIVCYPVHEGDYIIIIIMEAIIEHIHLAVTLLTFVLQFQGSNTGGDTAVRTEALLGFLGPSRQMLGCHFRQGTMAAFEIRHA